LCIRSERFDTEEQVSDSVTLARVHGAKVHLIGEIDGLASAETLQLCLMLVLGFSS